MGRFVRKFSVTFAGILLTFCIALSKWGQSTEVDFPPKIHTLDITDTDVFLSAVFDSD